MPDLEHLIREYGYLAVLLGTLVEGETILILGGISAHLGYLQLPLVMAAAFIGGYSGDLLLFYLGRRHGQAVLEKYPRLQARVGNFQGLLARSNYSLILGFRFLYGLRLVAPGGGPQPDSRRPLYYPGRLQRPDVGRGGGRLGLLFRPRPGDLPRRPQGLRTDNFRHPSGVGRGCRAYAAPQAALPGI